MKKLQWALRRASSKGNPSHYPSILKEYVSKIRFAEQVRHKGASYVSNDVAEVDKVTMSSGTPDAYVLFYDDTSRHHPDWNENCRKITELLENTDRSYSVTVVDCDLGHGALVVDCDLSDGGDGGGGAKVRRPVIEQRRNGKVIVTDVVEDHRELEGKCLIRCRDEVAVDRSRGVKAPPAKRIARVPCPIRQCHASGTYRWTCPECRTQVSYGFTDEYLYCQCSRYHYSLAVFKCKNPRHGKEYVGHDTAHLGKLLGALESEERYSILLLGECFCFLVSTPTRSLKPRLAFYAIRLSFLPSTSTLEVWLLAGTDFLDDLESLDPVWP